MMMRSRLPRTTFSPMAARSAAPETLGVEAITGVLLITLSGLASPNNGADQEQHGDHRCRSRCCSRLADANEAFAARRHTAIGRTGTGTTPRVTDRGAFVNVSGQDRLADVAIRAELTELVVCAADGPDVVLRAIRWVTRADQRAAGCRRIE